MFRNSSNLGRPPFPPKHQQQSDFFNKLPLNISPTLLSRQQIADAEFNFQNAAALLSGNLATIPAVTTQPMTYGNGSPVNTSEAPMSFRRRKRPSEESLSRDVKRPRFHSRHSETTVVDQAVPFPEERRCSFPGTIQSPLFRAQYRPGCVPPLRDTVFPDPIETVLPVAKDKLSQQVLELFRACQQQTCDLNRKELCRTQLQREIQQIFPQSRLFLVGSSLNGFGTRSSDGDLCLLVKEEPVNQKTEARHILSLVQKLFSTKLYMSKTADQLCGILYEYFGLAPLVIASGSDSQFTKALTQPPINLVQASVKCWEAFADKDVFGTGLPLECLVNLCKALEKASYIERPQLIRAKVPIVKFRDKVSCVEFDLNVNNVVGIRNTFLLRTYAYIENRVRPLVLVVKKWASFHDINDASRGTLSSYSLVLMVLHYLQTLPEPILPSLQKHYPEHFDPTMQLHLVHQASCTIPPYLSKNGSSLGDLLIGFFKYYATEFDWSHQMISVRDAKAIPRPDGIEWRNKFICIEEPFDGTNTARAVHEKQKFDIIRGEFLQAWHVLRNRKDLNYILPLRAAIQKR